MPFALARFSLSFFAIVFAASDVFAVAEKKSEIVEKYREAAIIANVAAELSKSPMASTFKQAILNSARSEDRDAVNRALASYKLGPLKIYSEFTKLTGYDKNETLIFSVEPVPGQPKKFVINGTEWVVPERGSIYRSIESLLTDKSSARNSFFNRLITPVDAADAQAVEKSTVATALYLYTVARSDGLSMAKVDGVVDFTDPSKNAVDGNLWDYIYGVSADIRCNGDVATGTYRNGDWQAKFEARGNAELRLTMPGRGHGVLIQPMKTEFKAKAQFVQATMGKVLAMKDKPDVSYAEMEKLETDTNDALKAIAELCRQVPAVPKTNEYRRPQKICLAALGFDKSGVVGRGNRIKREEGEDNRALILRARKEYILKAGEIFRIDREYLNGWLNHAGSVVEIHPGSRMVRACLNEACTEISNGEDDNAKIRLPPPEGREEAAVNKALDFSKSHRNAIEFDCVTKDLHCKTMQVNPVFKSSATIVEKERARKLTSQANEALKWNFENEERQKSYDNIRFLGQCCADKACRRNVELKHRLQFKDGPSSGGKVGQ